MTILSNVICYALHTWLLNVVCNIKKGSNRILILAIHLYSCVQIKTKASSMSFQRVADKKLDLLNTLFLYTWCSVLIYELYECILSYSFINDAKWYAAELKLQTVCAPTLFSRRNVTRVLLLALTVAHNSKASGIHRCYSSHSNALRGTFSSWWTWMSGQRTAALRTISN
jgi:hypothetical protein